MTRSMVFVTAVLASYICSCSGKTSTDAEEQKLMQTSREWSKVAGSGNMDGVLGYFDDSAVVISESQPPIRGKQAIQRYLAETSKIPGFKIEWEPQEAKVSGDMGYLIERTKITMNSPQGAPVTQEMQALTVWKKQTDGSWKNVIDMSTSAAPPRS
jgi:uncharacterized protein (TIGR02246 family)